MKRFINALIIFLFLTLSLNAQEIIEIYSGSVPNSKKSDVKEETRTGMFLNVTNPTLEAFLPEEGKATGEAVIICPGGSYAVVVYQGEGVNTAKEFARNGITAFVLKYRLPNDVIMIDKTIGPLQDIQQSFKVVRENAAKWGINPDKVGIMGFSAGGHLASTAATHYDKVVIENENGTNIRPDFQILVYPVISMQDKLTHLDSRKNLLGEDPSQEIIDEYSNEMQVNKNTPPAYLTHAGDDALVDVDNSISYYESLRHNEVPAEMHLYPKGNHGFVLRQPIEEWVKPILIWLKKLN